MNFCINDDDEMMIPSDNRQQQVTKTKRRRISDEESLEYTRTPSWLIQKLQTKEWGEVLIIPEFDEFTSRTISSSSISATSKNHDESNNNNNNNNINNDNNHTTKEELILECNTTTTTTTTTNNNNNNNTKNTDDNDDVDTYRQQNGWMGRDLIHDRHSPVRILKYYVKYGPGFPMTTPTTTPEPNTTRTPTIIISHRGGIGTCLTGVVYFSQYCESHIGYCHGGSICSIMDDVVGWCGFLVTGNCLPWSGYTVQINTSLQKPIPIYSTYLIRATITNIIRRKVYITAQLVCPSAPTTDSTTTAPEEIIHASCEGIFVVNKDIILPQSNNLEKMETM